MLQRWPKERDGDDKALRNDCGAFLLLLLIAPISPPTVSWRNRGKIERGESCSALL